MDKLQALRIFCNLADSLQFRETAVRLGMSPQVVSRMIAELEQELGDSLFQRNTRQVQLSDFGQQILPNAQQIVAESDQLFALKDLAKSQDYAGIVRITVPNSPLMHLLLPKLLVRLQAYPKLHLDWQMEMKISDKVAERIDMGIRMGNAPSDNSLIVKKVAQTYQQIVVAPSLIERLGQPKSWQDFTQNYPLAGYLDTNSQRISPWFINDEQIFQPTNPQFVSNNLQALLSATFTGNCAGLLHRQACAPYLATGELLELFPAMEKKHWGVYLYRPYRKILPARIKLVFELISEILQTEWND